jgi:hypothetical protein
LLVAIFPIFRAPWKSDTVTVPPMPMMAFDISSALRWSACVGHHAGAQLDGLDHVEADVALRRPVRDCITPWRRPTTGSMAAACAWPSASEPKALTELAEGGEVLRRRGGRHE